MQRIKQCHNSLLTEIIVLKPELLGGGNGGFRHKNTKLNQRIKLAVIAAPYGCDNIFYFVFVFGHCKAPFRMTNHLLFYHISKISQALFANPRKIKGAKLPAELNEIKSLFSEKFHTKTTDFFRLRNIFRLRIYFILAIL